MDSSDASASVGSAVRASMRTTKTSTLETFEKGKGASVRRTVRSPLPVPDESLHAARPKEPSAIAAKSGRVLFISHLLHECVGSLGSRWDRVQSASLSC